MTASNQLMTQQQAIDGALMEKVILGNDLSGLTPIEKVKYVNGVCKTLGLNPATNPIKLMKFQGKEIPYCSKDATEQLRKLNNVSIGNLDTKIIDGIYIVTAHASTPDGRVDSSTGVISMKGKVGDDLANAMMKAETKAKRRVTLSICGLGFMDESEAESLKAPNKVNVEMHQQAAANQKAITQQLADEASDLEIKFVDYLADIQASSDEDELKMVFTEIKKENFKAKPDLMKKLIDAKDKRKAEIMMAASIPLVEPEMNTMANEVAQGVV